jgi:hypothetical protein
MNEHERIIIIRLKAGIWSGVVRGIYLGEEYAKHVLLKCPETKNWKEELTCSKWLGTSVDIACRKDIS